MTYSILSKTTARRSLFTVTVSVFALITATAASAGESAADELAAKIVHKTGALHDVDSLAFTFVVAVDGTRKTQRRHQWFPHQGRLVVKHADQTITLSGLHQHDLSAAAAEPAQHADIWRQVAPDATARQAARAWSWFVNDSYWLLAPAKLTDPGVERTIDTRGRLVLTFDGVGLTPGDRYALTVDGDRGVVTRWDFTLESGKTGAFEWTDYRKFGPLFLSTRRPSVDGATVIRFEDIRVEPTPSAQQ